MACQQLKIEANLENFSSPAWLGSSGCFDDTLTLTQLQNATPHCWISRSDLDVSRPVLLTFPTSSAPLLYCSSKKSL